MSRRWLLMDIGCLECGEPSRVVGVFSNESAATQLQERLTAGDIVKKNGQHRFVVFQLPATGHVSSRYKGFEA